METFIYSIIFIIGTLLGSFFTLAVYRIPLKQDITHKRSYCPNCNHRLEILDLIPVLSYILLGGKCRYCKKKIRPRYILLEILSGVTLLFFAISLKMNIYNLEISKLIYFIFGIFYFGTLFIIGGIEKENHNISKPVLIFGIIIQTIYIIYLYTIGNSSVYRYVIYLIVMLILILINTILIAKKGKENYTLEILILCIYIAMATGKQSVVLGIISTLLLVAIKEITLIKKDNKKNILKENINRKIPFGFYLCIANIPIVILQNLLG